MAAQGTTGTAGRVTAAVEVALIVALAVLAAHNVLVERLPKWAYVPAGLTTTAVLLGAAAWSGVSADDLGLSGSALAAGLTAGVAIAAAEATVVAVAAIIPRTRALFTDRRMAGVGPWGTTYRALVRIPLGTVVVEEVAFRGVLIALFAPLLSMAGAVVMASVLFGLWHVVPTNATLDRNRVAASGRARRRALAAAVLFTAVVGLVFSGLRLATGSLVAPALVHASANVTATVAAFVVLRRARPAGEEETLSVVGCAP